MLTGYHLAQNIKGLGFTELHSKNRRDFARGIIQRSRLFQNADDKKWACAFQARVKDAQVTIASYPQDSIVQVKSVTKHDLMQNGLMKKSYEVTDNFLIGVLVHPSTVPLGQFRRRNLISRLVFRQPEWRFSWAPGSPTPSAEAAVSLAAILRFLTRVPIREIELSDGLLCFTHKHLEHHADIPQLAIELKALAAALAETPNSEVP